MSTAWRPRETTPEEDARAVLMAVGAGAAVGAVTFWLARTLLGRDPVRLEPPRIEAPDVDPDGSTAGTPRIGRGSGSGPE